MKIAVLTLTALLFGPTAFANTVESVFQSDSALPSELKERVLKAVSEKCAAGVLSFGLSEESTLVTEDQVDQGILDFYYTTTLRTRYLFDGMHSSVAYITVKSVQWDMHNPDFDRFDIREITSDAGICR